VSVILIDLKSNPGSIPGCMSVALDMVQDIVLDLVMGASLHGRDLDMVMGHHWPHGPVE